MLTSKFYSIRILGIFYVTEWPQYRSAFFRLQLSEDTFASKLLLLLSMHDGLKVLNCLLHWVLHEFLILLDLGNRADRHFCKSRQVSAPCESSAHDASTNRYSFEVLSMKLWKYTCLWMLEYSKSDTQNI